MDESWLKGLDEGYGTLRQSFKSGLSQSYEHRLSQLEAMEKIFAEKEKIAAALAEDLKRPLFEVEIFEISPTLGELRNAISNLKAWMRPEYVGTPPLLQLGSSRIERIPKGVVFVKLGATMRNLSAPASAQTCELRGPMVGSKRHKSVGGVR